MKLIKIIFIFSLCCNILSAHAGITGTPTPKSAQTAANTGDSHSDSDDDKSDDHNHDHDHDDH